MRFRWYVDRLRAMSPAEIALRTRDAAVKRAWYVAWRRRTAASHPPAVAGRAVRFATPFQSDVRDASPTAAVRDMCDAADNVLSGRWTVFGHERRDVGENVDWFLDPTSGRRSPEHAFAPAIAHRDEAVTGNVKQVWELSRHHHLTLLAAAYAFSRDDRYATAVAAQLTDWWRRNPHLTGIHWVSGIELGIRLLSWVWIRRLLDGWSGAEALFEGNGLFISQLADHQRYLAGLRAHGSSANNHLIAEAAGRFAAACAFPGLPEDGRWRDDAAAVLEREAARQTFDCGWNRELATDYHGFVLELLLAAGLEGERAGRPLGDGFWVRVVAMTDALAAGLDARLRPPRQGDGDDGVGLLLDAPGYNRWAALLRTGARVFGAQPWWPSVVQDDVRSHCWSLMRSGPLATPADRRPATRPNVFPGPGMVLLRGADPAGAEIWCRCDHGPLGFLATAAHGHADALSIELRHDGTDVLADPGTYCYHDQPEWRAYFRSTVAHNCLEIEETSQADPAGPFLWRTAPQARLVRLDGEEPTAPRAIWVAEHDGYQRLTPPVLHTRSVTLDRTAGALVVEDRIDTQLPSRCRLAFHLGPDVDCALDGRVATLGWPGSGSRREARLFLPNQLDWRAARGETSPPLGWYSPGFGRRVPAWTLIGSGRMAQDDRCVTRLEFRQ